MSTATDTSTATEPQKIVASEITIVDRTGKPRIRLGVDEDGTAAVKFYNANEQLRMILYLKQPYDDDGVTMSEHGEVGLIMIERSDAIRLGIMEDGLFQRSPRLQIVQGVGGRKRFQVFPPRPPNVSD